MNFQDFINSLDKEKFKFNIKVSSENNEDINDLVAKIMSENFKQTLNLLELYHNWLQAQVLNQE